MLVDLGTVVAGNPEASLSASRVAPPLTLDDIAIPDGRQLAGAASLIVVGASGDVFNADAVVSAGADPPNVGAQAPTRIYLTGRTQLRISVTTGGDIEAEWSAGGALEDHQLHVQTSATEVVSYGRGDIDDGPTNDRRLIVGARNDPDGLLDDVAALTSGDVVIWFLTEPIPPADVSIDPGTTEASTPEASLSAVPTVDPVTADPGETAAANPEASLSAVPTVDVPTADPGETAAGDPEASLSAVPTIDLVAADPGTTTAGNPEAELTAAVQTVPVGVSVFDLGNLGFRDGPWEGAVRIDPRYIENGAEAWLRYLDRAGSSIRLRLSSTETEEPSDEGPEFTLALKEYESALTFTDDDGSIVLPGPGHDSNSFSDPTEPYFWTPPAALGWAAWVQNITGNVTLTLDDGVELQPSLADPGTTSAGSPEAELTAIPMVDPVTVDTGQVAAGNPQAELTAVPTLDPVLADPATVRAGNPEASLSAVIVGGIPVLVDPGETAAPAPEGEVSAVPEFPFATVADPGQTNAGAPEASLTAVPTLDPVLADPGSVAAGAPEADLTVVVHIDPVIADPGTVAAGNPEAVLSALVGTPDPILVDPGRTAAGNPDAELSAVARVFVRTWPVSLPDVFLRRGFNLAPEENTVRFPVDSGAPLGRPRFTSSEVIYRGIVTMTPEQWKVFRSFYRSDLSGGRDPFEFPSPLDAGEILVKFAGQPRRVRRGANWDISFALRPE